MLSVKKPGTEWGDRNEHKRVFNNTKSCHYEDRLDRFYIVPGKQMKIKKRKSLKIS